MNTPVIPALLAKFDELSDTYHREAVEEALGYQAELTPHLLKIIENLAENPLVYFLEQHNYHVYATALLSHFREPAAHLAIIKAFSIPEEQLVDLWGDVTTETLPTILYRTCDGSIEAIKALIVNREVDQYVRCAAMEALSYVVAFDSSRRDEVVRFLQGLFTGKEAAQDSYYWGNLTATLCDLHPGESMEILRQAYTNKIIRTDFIGLEGVEKAAENSQEASMAALQTWVRSRMPADIHGYISWFAEFNQEDTAPPPPVQKTPAPKKAPSKPKKKPAKKSPKKNRS